ncbi:hypothetical protein pEaSNUABM8_00292 [Erwinia phage pEa_SNUABM_8]|nr:hypothetical protein pEaSNUABM8_00292 [Erwinia phage pEa_SNUABM_8]QVW55044.1 hypothetical protein pEaSNUABM4_00291 [Erwinia phage pEa_SNUABM_4]
MFLLQTHTDILTNPIYRTCKEAKEFLFPVSMAHMEALRQRRYLATIENGVAVRLQMLTAVDNTIYIYVDKYSPLIEKELSMALRRDLHEYPGNFFVACEAEGRDRNMRAATFGFTIPEELQSLNALTPIIGEKNAREQMQFISQLQPGHELVMNWTPDELMAEHFTTMGLKFVTVFYPL